MDPGSACRQAVSIWLGAVCLLSGMLLCHIVPAAAEPPSFATVLAGMKERMAATNDYQCRFETQ